MFRPAEEKEFAHEIHLLKRIAIFYDLALDEFRTKIKTTPERARDQLFSHKIIDVLDEHGSLLDRGSYAHIALAKVSCNKCIATLMNMQENKKIATSDHKLLLQHAGLRQNYRIQLYPHTENYHKKGGEVPGGTSLGH